MIGDKRTVTIQDVAREAGVSVGSVSRVINGASEVKKSTRQAVERAIRELDYIPNASAQSMRNRASKVICCVLREINISQLADFVRETHNAMDEAGYRLLITNSEGKKEREIEVLKIVIRGQADGIMIGPYTPAEGEFGELLKSLRNRVVLIDRRSPEWADCVMVDHASGIRKATEHLLSLGHRRIALITGPKALYPAAEKIKGFTEAFALRGLPLDDDLIQTQGFGAEAGFRVASSLLRWSNPPTAIICGGLDVLPGVLRATHTLGLTVPRDLSIVGVGKTDLSELHNPSISIVNWDQGEVGRIATSILLDRLSLGEGAPPQRVVVPTEFIDAGSCGPPRSKISPVDQRMPGAG